MDDTKEIIQDCSTCRIPVKERPGCLVKCISVGAYGVHVSFNFKGWQPKEKNRCNDCARAKCPEACREDKYGRCAEFIQKICETCGWHGRHWDHTDRGKCLWPKHADQSFNYTNNHKADSNCSWKPICETCGGTGEICDVCGNPKNKCTGVFIAEPCIKCQPKTPQRRC